MRAPGTGDDDVQGVTIALGEDEQREVTIIVESQGGQIRGRVVEDAGGPVSDAFIQVTRESDSAAAGKGHNRAKARWGGWMDTPVMTDEEGRFTMTKLAEGARYTVFAHRKGGGEGIAEHVEVGSSGVEVVIAPTGSISGKVTLADGTAPIEVSVKVHDALTGVQRADKFYRTDGVFVFENLPAGKYELVASTTKGDATTEVELAKGATQDGIDLQLTSRVTVKGRVVDAETNEPISGMVVRIQKDGGSFIWTSGGDHGEDAKYVTDASGRFEVENAPAGEVKMWVMSRTRGAGDYNPLWANERIPDDEDPFEMPTIELIKKRLDDEEQPGDLGFKLREGDAGQDRNEGDLIIAFIRPGGPADKAGLSVGDKITTVDGHDVTGEHKSRYWALTRVKEGTALDIGLDSGTSVELVAAKPL
jgi:hypothetical protein